MSEQVNMISFKGDNAVLTLELLSYEYTDMADVSGGNSIVTRVRAATSAFQADLTQIIYPFDLVSLRDKVAILSTMSEGRVDWTIQDGFLMLTADRSRLGHIHWTIELSSLSGRESSTRLFLEINNDQTYLSDLIREIDAVLEVFPVRGNGQTAGIPFA